MSLKTTIEAVGNLPGDVEKIVYVNYITKDEDGNFVANDLCTADDLKALVIKLEQYEASLKQIANLLCK